LHPIDYLDLRRERMKIAVITENEHTISQHFGRAPYYLVVTIEDSRIVQRELRDKLGHAQFSDEPHAPEVPGQLHGLGPAAHGRHMRMAEAIDDCEALLCGGMGAGAYQSLQARGIKPVVTDIEAIDAAVMAYVEGRIVDRTEWLH
jgi:predicted Fe-Mo cluster-binding NifX family protein